MTKYLHNTMLHELLPSSINFDPTFIQSSQSIDDTLKVLLAQIPQNLLWARLLGNKEELAPALKRLAEMGVFKNLDDGQDEILVNMLANQLHVEDYDIAKSYEEKLAMVRQSIKIHRKKGTKWAVETAVNAAIKNTDTRLIEWFDYNAPPYHFKAEMTVYAEELSAEHQARAFRIIESTKSLRSHCDGMTLVLGMQGENYLGGMLGMGMSIEIEPEQVKNISLEYGQRLGGVQQFHNIISISAE